MYIYVGRNTYFVCYTITTKKKIKIKRLSQKSQSKKDTIYKKDQDEKKKIVSFFILFDMAEI